ncbi:acyltransferase [Leptodesmis sichuanensis]|uniref:acyltransferase n=1 Tax=Leptodesmis sichuanensis TaxID=2906798 RepID=UPI001F41165C|nr:acyltransferase [Leptodesmis sichuanensis]UIE37506.1 acyltransferase [Leptodesmis sichuanensis A121]
MSQNKRVLGIDLCRGIAAYAVILVHSGDETWGVPIDQEAISFRLLFYFAVPFFLAASFYFMMHKPRAGSSLEFWKSRLERIVIPYVLWSVIYLLLRLFFFYKSNQLDRLDQLFQDPLAIAFCGGASYHLYFLPLLLAGSTLILFKNYFSDIQTKIIIFFCLVSIATRELVSVSGNGWKIGSSLAFQGVLEALSLNIDAYPSLKLALVYAYWVLLCLPYFFVAIILSRVFSKDRVLWLSRISIIITFILFLIADIFGNLFLPGTVRDLIMAYSLLLFGISISQPINEWSNRNNSNLGRIVSSLGVCSFGIYLLHPIPMNVSKLFLSRLGFKSQVTVISMLIISMTTFLLSWITVSLMLKHKWSAKYLLGV